MHADTTDKARVAEHHKLDHARRGDACEYIISASLARPSHWLPPAAPSRRRRGVSTISDSDYYTNGSNGT